MNRMRHVTRVGVIVALWLVPAAAQERIGGGSPDQHYRAGWTFTPAIGFAETYDDNISLFGRGSVDGANRDYIASYFPEANLHFAGRHTLFDAGYSGTFLNYRTFTALNRWNQHGKIELQRQQTARLKWYANASAAALPSTDLVDLGSIPFRHIGAQTITGRAGFEYAIGTHSSLTASYHAQSVTFDRPAELTSILRGGHMQQILTTYRRKLDERLAIGADYTFRRSTALGDFADFDLHEALAAADYDLSQSWSISAGGGVVYLLPTALTVSRTGPAYHVTLARHRNLSIFRIGYLRSYLPSFGFGGTVQNQEVGANLHLPLFGSRRFYTEHSATFRDTQPLTAIEAQLPLRSLRTVSVLGWEPQAWMRLEVFYARVQQSTLRPGGQVDRNRVGFQIVTSHSVRMQ